MEVTSRHDRSWGLKASIQTNEQIKSYAFRGYNFQTPCIHFMYIFEKDCNFVCSDYVFYFHFIIVKLLLLSIGMISNVQPRGKTM